MLIPWKKSQRGVGVIMFIPMETYSTCDVPAGVRIPSLPMLSFSEATDKNISV